MYDQIQTNRIIFSLSKSVQSEANQNVAEEFSALHNQFEKKCESRNDIDFEDSKRIHAGNFLNTISQLETGLFI
jgi:hypothetical protein